MLMLILHIVIAILSLVLSALTLAHPSTKRIKVVGVATMATLATGSILVAEGADILHMCVSGLLFTSLTVAAMTVSSRMLRRQQAAVRVR